MGDVFDDIKEVVAKHLPAVALDEFSKRLAALAKAREERLRAAEAAITIDGTKPNPAYWAWMRAKAAHEKVEREAREGKA